MNEAIISIIIPVLNEEKTIISVLSKLQNTPNLEMIIVDGGSQDNTIKVVDKFGKNTNIEVRILETIRGRAHQMNMGAKAATGEILLFLHADTQLPERFEKWVRQVLDEPNIIAGAFELKIAASVIGLRWVEQGVKWRSQYLQMPYGDQGIFLKASTFWEVGGFPELPLMEDFQLVRQLRRRGKIVLVPVAVTTSGRRWQKLGVLRTTLINQMIIIAYLLGISPSTLANWYRSKQ
ncbi:TIGR04283 family arsenosugar biosynthesis glycosyltransferase [Limnoraphis robusta]|uniref:4,4'-diaponeurosporenoate glycosyltransferase n=1 Tax=Limnoraphis robusta CCNP1315 TaxID=3110306 RepID=A0ABU5U1S4_9CYAN|nr:TIGR04283 family arsenosugar biosynthesis glycosyltransferase [Limnoraphis robusta]MEA5520950.1 TIGR04283 family arsenosugar biosynthesis glycosyltransferase [Limnoraphis robusta CCNP1315]MEA5543657.1 TIGR04283 family arsenosugar biosynthesis glycosyltransferase [Limnoraphis robusta CCNP1324]